ncbi:MAG TPA: hypothetical protein VF223_00430 [Trebonia sp.]
MALEIKEITEGGGRCRLLAGATVLALAGTAPAEDYYPGTLTGATGLRGSGPGRD